MNALVLRLAAAAATVVTAEQALELARNLAAVALLGPVSASEWLELVDDALRARTRVRAGSAWLLEAAQIAPLRIALVTCGEVSAAAP